MKLTYSLILAAAASGLAFGSSTAYTTPVGYEALSLPVGTTYVGLRLQQPTVLAGSVKGISATQLTDTSVNFATALPGGATVTYIVEFENAKGIIQEVTGAAAGTTTLNLPQDVTAFVSVGDTYRIRPAGTIASVFGPADESGLDPGYGGPFGADLVQVPDGAGGLSQYYYDGDASSWYKVASTPIPVDGSTIPLVYTDAFLVVINTTAKSLNVSGEVKTKAVNQALAAGTNYLGSVYPAGATLSSAFNTAAVAGTINPGYGGPFGADLIQYVEGGVFKQYYYDGDASSWYKVAATPILVDGSTIALPSGFIYVNAAAAYNLLNTPPSAYSGL